MKAVILPEKNSNSVRVVVGSSYFMGFPNALRDLAEQAALEASQTPKDEWGPLKQKFSEEKMLRLDGELGRNKLVMGARMGGKGKGEVVALEGQPGEMRLRNPAPSERLAKAPEEFATFRARVEAGMEREEPREEPHPSVPSPWGEGKEGGEGNGENGAIKPPPVGESIWRDVGDQISVEELFKLLRRGEGITDKERELLELNGKVWELAEQVKRAKNDLMNVQMQHDELEKQWMWACDAAKDFLETILEGSLK